MKIILISGKSGSGKSTFGRILQKEYNKKGYHAITTQFSKYLKIYAKDYFNWNGKDNTKPREFLQTLGYEIIREKLNMKYFLINRFKEDVNILSEYFNVFIVTDVRVKEEIEELKKTYSDIITIRINSNKKTKLTPQEKNHPTENLLDDYPNFDYIINNTSLAYLHTKTKEIVK